MSESEALLSQLGVLLSQPGAWSSQLRVYWCVRTLRDRLEDYTGQKRSSLDLYLVRGWITYPQAPCSLLVPKALPGSLEPVVPLTVRRSFSAE